MPDVTVERALIRLIQAGDVARFRALAGSLGVWGRHQYAAEPSG